jgi:hypothetical protein
MELRVLVKDIIMGAGTKEKNATDLSMERENSFTKTAVTTMDNGKTIKWMA